MGSGRGRGGRVGCPALTRPDPPSSHSLACISPMTRRPSCWSTHASDCTVVLSCTLLALPGGTPLLRCQELSILLRQLNATLLPTLLRFFTPIIPIITLFLLRQLLLPILPYFVLLRQLNVLLPVLLCFPSSACVS